MSENEIYNDGHNCASEVFVIYRINQRGQLADHKAPGQEFQHIADGLRVLECFSPLQPTLTTDEISDLLELPEREVTQYAARLVGLGYLRAVPSSGDGAWTLIDVEDTW